MFARLLVIDWYKHGKIMRIIVAPSAWIRSFSYNYRPQNVKYVITKLLLYARRLKDMKTQSSAYQTLTFKKAVLHETSKSNTFHHIQKRCSILTTQRSSAEHKFVQYASISAIRSPDPAGIPTYAREDSMDIVNTMLCSDYSGRPQRVVVVWRHPLRSIRLRCAFPRPVR
jgi:hypothetical protein